ncbi:MAG TPA: hypothetical protein VJ183_10285 [Chloroflexia bacterium]|nr:hypothetical protein [Chloroflexia bacterium]
MRETNINVGRALVASVAAGTGYLASTWLDSKLSSHPFNDLKLVGQIFTTKSPLWQMQGVVGHYGFSVIVAFTYAAWFYRSLPGPPWLRGLIFLQIENTSLYPLGLAIGVDRLHAGIKRGQLPPLANMKTFKGQVVRHVAFGLMLGAIYRPKDGAKDLTQM